MGRYGHRIAVLAAVTAALMPASAQALGISISGSTALGTLTPGQTATSGPVTVTVSGVLTTWSITVAAANTATPGHLRPTSGTCTGSTSSLTQPLHVNTTKTLGTTTVDAPSLNFGSGTTQLAHGTVADVLTQTFSQQVVNGDAITSGCNYSLIVTYTVS